MSTTTRPPAKPRVIYPDSDGKPMAENTVQFRYIVTIQGGLDELFRDEAVFIAGDLLWYPVEGDNKISIAADVFAAFGRPKGDRGSYKQWEEGGVAPQVVFEIWSPGNRMPEMIEKFLFYEKYGVEEYYVYHPDFNELAGWLREGGRLREIKQMQDWVSPRLKVRFDTSSGELVLFRPDGRPFATYLELTALWEAERLAKEQAQRRAEQAQQQAEQAQRQAADQARKAERLAAQLRALGVEPEP